MKLTQRQKDMLKASGRDPKDGNGYGLGLVGPGNWTVARRLEELGLGWIEETRDQWPRGMFFANKDGVFWGGNAPKEEPEE